MSNVKAIPEGQEAPIPYLAVKGAASAIDWYKKVFGAEELFRVENGGMVGHAELAIGGGRIFLADEFPDMDVRGPKSIGGTPVTIHLYVEDVDALASRAAEAGAKFSRAVETQFYGDRGGKFEDPFGHQWWIATHVEDVSPEEMKRRAKELFGA
jgi:PhnB protein